MPVVWPRCVVGAVVGALLSATSAASAQNVKRVLYTKAAFGATLSRSTLDVPDTSAHRLVQSFRIDRGTTDDPDFAIDEEHVWGQGEVGGRAARSGGYAIYKMKGGSQVFLRWTADPKPTGTRADGEPASGSGTITIYGGTGRFAGVRGSGSYREYRKGPVVEENVLDVTVP